MTGWTLPTGRATAPSADAASKRPRTNRAHKRCTRFVALCGSLTRTRPAGADRFKFTGRLAGHRLEPGRYRLVATPSARGRTGKPSRAAFRIVK